MLDLYSIAHTEAAHCCVLIDVKSLQKWKNVPLAALVE